MMSGRVHNKGEALIQLSRVSGNEQDEMQLNIIHEGTHIRLGIPMIGFAELLTGAAHIPATVRRWEKKK